MLQNFSSIILCTYRFQEKGSGDNAQDVEQLEESKSVNDGNKSIATYTKEPEGKESDTTSIIKSVATYAKEPECKESNTIYSIVVSFLWLSKIFLYEQAVGLETKSSCGITKTASTLLYCRKNNECLMGTQNL